VLHALPLAYNKDLQEDKEHLFDTVDTLELALNAASGMVEGVRFNRERLAQAASDEMLAATDVADLLVKRGVPFRQAHGVVAGLVRHSIERGVALSELTEEELAELAPSLDAGYYGVLAQSSWLESKISAGGTALDRVREQLEHAREILEQQTSLTR
jgi:argininosuccinate lyase